MSVEAVPVGMQKSCGLRTFLHARDEGHGGDSGIPLRNRGELFAPVSASARISAALRIKKACAEGD